MPGLCQVPASCLSCKVFAVQKMASVTRMDSSNIQTRRKLTLQIFIFKCNSLFLLFMNIIIFCYRAKQMLEQIDKILKSNWSSSWFQKSSQQISPKFEGAQPTNNLLSMSDQVLKILLNNSNHPGNDHNNKQPPSKRRSSRSASSSNSDDEVDASDHTRIDMSTLDRAKLHHLLVERGNMSENAFDSLMRSNVSVDNGEMRAFLVENLQSDEIRQGGLSIGHERRVTLMSRLFCDPKRFAKIVHVQSIDLKIKL